MPATQGGDEHLRRDVAAIGELVNRLRIRMRRFTRRVGELRDLSVEHDAQAATIDAKTTLILDSVRKLLERIEGTGMRDGYEVRIERNATKIEAIREEVLELRRLLKESQNSQSGWVMLVAGAIISGAVAYVVAALTK